jgi:hypothetical protein
LTQKSSNVNNENISSINNNTSSYQPSFMGALSKPKIAEPMSGKPLLRDPNAALGVLKKPANLGTLANYENKF